MGSWLPMGNLHDTQKWTPPAAARFGSYQVQPVGEDTAQVRLTLPGQQSAQRVVAEVYSARLDPATGKPIITTQQPHRLEMQRTGLGWSASADEVTLHAKDRQALYYRFLVEKNGQTHFLTDLLQTDTIQGQPFGLIHPDEARGPAYLGPILDLFQDSLLPLNETAPANLPKQLAQTTPHQRYRDHFNRFSLQSPGLAEQALREDVLPYMVRQGYGALMLRPIIGGDFQTSHGYATSDPGLLNNTFASKSSLKHYLQDSLGTGVQMVWDGAFVNQGLNGLQYWSILQHGQAAHDYLDWFMHGGFQKTPGARAYPEYFHENPVKIGIFPVVNDPQTRQPVRNDEAIGIRLINPPGQPDYDPKRPCFVETYPARLQNPDGTPTSYPEQLRASSDAVPVKRFEVRPEEIRQKLKLLGSSASVVNLYGRRALAFDAQHHSGTQGWTHSLNTLSRWSTFQLVTPFERNSPYEWDGQIDVVKMNIENPQVQQYVRDSMQYWTRFVRNAYVESVAAALSQVPVPSDLKDAAQLSQWVNHIQRTERGLNGAPGTESSLESHSVLPPVRQAFTAFENPEAIARQFQSLAQRVDLQPVPEKQMTHRLAQTVLTEYPLVALPLRDGDFPVPFKATLTYPTLATDLRWGEGWLTGARRTLATVGSILTTPIKGTGLYRALHSLSARVPGLRPYESILTDTLQQLTARLPEDIRPSLRSPLVQSVVTGEFAEALMLRLLTGVDPLADQTATPDTLLDGLYKTLPDALLKADPQSGAKMMVGFLKQRLADLQPKDLDQLAVDLQALLTGSREADPSSRRYRLTHENTLMALAAVQSRRLGLHWRLDAAKDFGDIDTHRNRVGRDMQTAFPKLFNDVFKLWSHVLGGVQDVFPQGSVIAEMTLLPDLAKGDMPAVGDTLRQFFRGLFTGQPFYDFYNRYVRVVHEGDRPDDRGETQMTPAAAMNDFYNGSRILDFRSTLGGQVFAANHDSQTMSDTMAKNLFLGFMDQEKYSRLPMDWFNSLLELRTKPILAEERSLLSRTLGLSAAELEDALLKLTWITDPAVLEGQPSGEGAATQPALVTDAGVLKYMTETGKKSAFGNVPLPTPRDVKRRLVEELFKDDRLIQLRGLDPQRFSFLNLSSSAEAVAQQALRTLTTPMELGLRQNTSMMDILRDAQHPFWSDVRQQLRQHGAEAEYESVHKTLCLTGTIANRLLEPSEVKAVRGTLNNVLFGEHFQWNRVLSSVPAAQQATFRQQYEVALARAFNRAAAEMGRHLGFEEQSNLNENVLKHVKDCWPGTLPPEATLQPVLQETRKALYASVLIPVMEKDLRAIALMRGQPGQMSLYGADVLGALTGGEHDKNVTVQCRQLLRTDWAIQAERLAAEAAQAGVRSTDRSAFTQWLETKSTQPGAVSLLKEQSPEFVAYFVEYQQQIKALVSLEQQYPAFSNGVLVDIRSPELEKTVNDTGVIPFVRENGDQLLVYLVNTAKPTPAMNNGDASPDNAFHPTWENRIGGGRFYAMPHSTQPVATHVKLNLAKLDLPVGSQFEDEQGRLYVLNEAQELVDARTAQGLDVPVFRLLRLRPSPQTVASSA
ncbi:MAG: hypothetical protein SFZ03_03720 [Candidatus Melainabacteria bacterium]|nr:hypothetical protein [Candidatus Melainabacteria bacterium]